MYNIYYDMLANELVLILYKEPTFFPVRGKVKDKVVLYTEEYFFKHLMLIGKL